MNIFTKIVTLFFATGLMSFGIIAQECSYDSYNQLINASAILVTQKKLNKAKDSLISAFNLVETPIGRDLQKALNIAIKTKDADMIHNLAVRLAKGGVPMYCFTRFKSHTWFPDFKKRFPAYDSIYKNTYNLEYKERLINLINYDRGFNKRYHQWRSGKIEMTLKEMIAEAKYIAEEFESLINEFGLPVEKKTGIFMTGSIKKLQIFP